MQLYFWTHSFSSPKWRNLLAWIVGCRCFQIGGMASSYRYADANTVGTIAAIASIDWGAAIQIMAAVGIGSNGSFVATNPQTLFVALMFLSLTMIRVAHSRYMQWCLRRHRA